MENTISFMTANFVARQLDYRMTEGWAEGEAATCEFFRPIETFSLRFGAMLDEIVNLGFSAIDLWSAHLSPLWATDRHIEQAWELLSRRGISVSSLAYWINDDMAFMGRTAAIAKALDVRIIGAGCAPSLLEDGRRKLTGWLAQNDLILGFENHPEKSAREVLGKIGNRGGGRIGVTVDTGWFGSQGCDAEAAVRELGERIVHMHMKDIHQPQIGAGPTLKDMGHDTCALGDGVVPVERCIAALKGIGYRGGISVEHEPEEHDPTREIKTSFKRLKRWLAQA